MAENNDNEVRHVAWTSIVLTAFISLGASIMAVGMSVWFTILPLLRDMIKSGVFSDQDSAFINFLNNNALYYTGIGLAIVAISIFGAYVKFYRTSRFKKI